TCCGSSAWARPVAAKKEAEATRAATSERDMTGSPESGLHRGAGAPIGRAARGSREIDPPWTKRRRPPAMAREGPSSSARRRRLRSEAVVVAVPVATGRRLLLLRALRDEALRREHE